MYAILAFTLSSVSRSVIDKIGKTESITKDSLYNKQKLEIQQIKAAQ